MANGTATLDWSAIVEEATGVQKKRRAAGPVGNFMLAFLRAFWRFNRDDGWAIASHIALSGLMALFPFLIFCTSLAAFFHLGQFPAEATELIRYSFPRNVADPIADQIKTVLTVPRGDALTLGAAAALFFASNGVEALRLGLNRAYRVVDMRNFLWLRLQSIGFVIIAAIIIATVTVLLVLLPLGLAVAQRHVPMLQGELASLEFWRLVSAGSILIVALLACHTWLPAGTRSLRKMLPGLLFTLVCWIVSAMAFSAYLSSFANYVSTYAGLASIMVALVFFYLMAVIFLLGAELNAALEANRLG